MDDPRLEVRALDDGRLQAWRIVAPPGNVLDRSLIEALRTQLAAARRARPRPHALLLGAAGADFSFGASIQEHRKETVGALLRSFHAFVRELLGAGLPLAAAVRGRCLGGGLELALLAQRLFVAPDAQFGAPEVRLGLFAPVASLLLPARIGQPAADELLLSGRSVGAEEALRLRLADAIAADPDAEALAFARRDWTPLSASGLAYASLAARFDLLERVDGQLARIERLYRGELMATHDAVEGVEAFLAKRPPRFER